MLRLGPFACILGSLALAGVAAPARASDDEAWIDLFDGESLAGWVPKISGQPLGLDPAGTFRVEDGLLVVRYDGYSTFDERFGHLFFERPFAYYRLRVDYRFVGEQAPGGPGLWAVRNSGVMVHAQAPQTMALAQSFPVSVEAQFLGGLGDGEHRPTANVCTPGTEIVYDGRIHPEHCLVSTSPTYHGDAWITVEIEVLGGAQITHRVNGETVLTYALPQLGGWGMEGLDAARRGELLEGGFIALQSESHPIEFRRVQLLDLAGCMDPEAANYRAYFVKSSPDACRYANHR